VHSIDSQYKVQALRAVQTLLQGSGGTFSRIPESYAQHLTHEYSDGNVSLLSKINTFEFSEDLEDWQIVEAMEDLSKVDPNDWPELDDISTISLDAVYHGRDIDGFPSLDVEDFAEVSDMEYGNKVARMFKSAIESVFGQEVDSVGGSKGDMPSKNNQYCRDGDAFRGTFEHDGKKFEFELCKDDAGDWNLAYKLHKQSRDKLFKPAADTKQKGKK
jgi:hypothetical protein